MTRLIVLYLLPHSFFDLPSLLFDGVLLASPHAFLLD
jgi:hypothetical protein